MLIKSLPEEERPREKAKKLGVRSLSDAELIALIIRTGRKDTSSVAIAEEVLSRLDQGLFSLGHLDQEELVAIPGIGEGKASSILAAVELGKRLARSRRPERSVLESSDGIADMFMEDLRYENKEYFKSVMLNSKGEVISVENVSTGELTSAPVHPREVFTNAIKKSAYGVIFVHNHPSGDPSPSEQDIYTTKRLIEGGNILGIKVLDHVIIGDGTYSSLRDLSIID